MGDVVSVISECNNVSLNKDDDTQMVYFLVIRTPSHANIKARNTLIYYIEYMSFL